MILKFFQQTKDLNKSLQALVFDPVRGSFTFMKYFYEQFLSPQREEPAALKEGLKDSLIWGSPVLEVEQKTTTMEPLGQQPVINHRIMFREVNSVSGGIFKLFRTNFSLFVYYFCLHPWLCRLLQKGAVCTKVLVKGLLHNR